MRKLFVAALILVASTFQALAETSVGITLKTKAKWNGSECVTTDRGLCVRVTVGSAMIAPDEFNGTIEFNKLQNEFILKFDKRNLSQNIRSGYFSNGSFYVDANSAVQQEVLSKIGYSSLTRGYELKQGKYKYTVEGDIITVVIPAN